MLEELEGHESCTWCGQPGSIEQVDLWVGPGFLEDCNLVLCHLCSYSLSMSGDVIDAMYRNRLTVRMPRFKSPALAAQR
jgi:hypothetical protein